MNDHDRSIGRLLLQRGLVQQDSLRRAGERTDQMRASGPYVELLKVLVDMQLLHVDMARSIWSEVGADPNSQQVPQHAAVAAPPSPGDLPPLPHTLDPDGPQPGFGGFGGIPKTLDPDGPQPGFGGFGGIPKTLDPDGPQPGFGGIPKTLDPDGPQPGFGGIPKTLDPDGPQPGFGGIPKTLDPDGPQPGGYDPDGATLIQPGGIGSLGDPPLGLESFERPPAETSAGSGFAVPAFNPAGFGQPAAGDFGGPGGAGLGGGGASDFSPVDDAFGAPPTGSGFGAPGADTGFGAPAGQDTGFGTGFGAPAGQDTGFGTGFGAPAGQDTGFGTGFGAPGGSGFGAPGGSGFGAPGGSGFGAPGGSGFGAPGGSGFGAPGGSGFGLPGASAFGAPNPLAPESGIEQSMGPSSQAPGGKKAPSKRSKRTGGVSSRRAGRASGRKTLSERAGARSSARHAGQSSSKTAVTLVAILVVSIAVIGGVLYGISGSKTQADGGGSTPGTGTNDGNTGGGGNTGEGGETGDGGVDVVDVGDGKLEWHQHRYKAPQTPAEIEETCAFLAEKAVGDAKDFVFEGDYKRAVEFLESFPKELQEGTAYADVSKALSKFKQYQLYKENLDGILAGDDRAKLKETVRTILSGDLSPELSELQCNSDFLNQAQDILGPEYAEIEVDQVTDD